MMVDLVSQLRDGVEKKYSRESLETMLIWAADEIERLREANNTWVALHGPSPVPSPVQRAYALLWRDMEPPTDYAKQARKILRELLSYEQTRAAIHWVKQIHPIDDDETEVALQRT